MNAPMPPRCSLAQLAPSGDGRTEEERAEDARRELWQQHGIAAFRLESTRPLAWQIIEAEANRLYGRRRGG